MVCIIVNITSPSCETPNIIFFLLHLNWEIHDNMMQCFHLNLLRKSGCCYLLRTISVWMYPIYISFNAIFAKQTCWGSQPPWGNRRIQIHYDMNAGLFRERFRSFGGWNVQCVMAWGRAISLFINQMAHGSLRDPNWVLSLCARVDVERWQPKAVIGVWKCILCAIMIVCVKIMLIYKMTEMFGKVSNVAVWHKRFLQK